MPLWVRWHKSAQQVAFFESVLTKRIMTASRYRRKACRMAITLVVLTLWMEKGSAMSMLNLESFCEASLKTEPYENRVLPGFVGADYLK